MCGIIGYIGKKEAWPVLYKGLERLEYRGYDSAGIALLDKGTFSVYKKKGRVAELAKFEKEKKDNELSGGVGIAHTRWATHGVPSDRNAHPHLSNGGDIVIVHNGIIENYLSIKKVLIGKGYKFKSDTDTEVLANLIEDIKKNAKVAIDEAVRLALAQIVGAYAVLVLSKDEPGVMVVAKVGSPAIIGVGKGEFFVASDATPIVDHTKKVIYLGDGEMAVINTAKNGKLTLKIKTVGNKVIKNPYVHTLKTKIEELEKGGYPHFMLKEIFEQPESLRNTMRGRIVLEKGNVKFGGLEKFKKELKSLRRITIAGMGTARFTGLVGEYAFEELAGIPTKVEYGSEFTYRETVAHKNTGLLAISQSGETLDTLNAIKKAKSERMLTLGIVNVIGSSIAREVDAGIYNHVGPETAVASTKASTSQVLLQIMLAIYLGRMRGLSKKKGQEILKEILVLPNLVEKILKNANTIKKLAKKYKNYNNFFFLGRKYNAAAALEGALKLKECSYIHAEGCNSTELKHGPLSLIDKNFPTLVITPTDSIYEKSKSSIQEIKARGGLVIALTTEGNKELEKMADDVIYIPKTLEMLYPILAFVPMQLLAYYIAVERGNDVDKPRNLAKSVTVE
ncbi:glutamine--fructose-6-phosphate aminotransferase [Candidatus Nomurabacteria bacterium RIFCSPLOWO2_02_FULL_40_10]|uniref:Glutamine--fructose-6-phosphate aminotransferase [isomerizing] n=2 Tax=Candidatus Nomuraibacteriota TaxID=1752729 RepID=A0A1F6Y0P4_9BACT|nr:MAG: glutamine--fructose-6-phosphate aminotransferase [Candidatus Nomurabacteria bacterium RIFCSPHIGHO2_01_FULL_39_10]OGI99914.1 MAG: glutamine--fructose-6-phosphate aminotransferase [Candidatus Nomurabacteria bacterium RIFCSPLOWO2_02_FULL_40_10]